MAQISTPSTHGSTSLVSPSSTTYLPAIFNNALRQDDRTSSFIHRIPDLIAYLSRYHVLQAGDVICTGTPAGAGLFSERFLSPGDVVEVEVEGIGVLTNPVTTRS